MRDRSIVIPRERITNKLQNKVLSRDVKLFFNRPDLAPEVTLYGAFIDERKDLIGKHVSGPLDMVPHRKS